MTRRRREARPHRPPTRPEDSPEAPGWMNIDGEQMFVVDFTPAGFPIGMWQDDAPHWLDDE